MMDLIKSLIGTFFAIFSIVVLAWGSGYSIILGVILFFLCIAISVFMLQSISSDTLRKVKRQQDSRRMLYLYKKYEKSKHGYICPYCGYPAGEKVDQEGDLDYTYCCWNCCYVW